MACFKNAVYISYFSSVCKTPDLIRKCFSSLLPFCIYFTHTKPLFIATKLLTSHKIYWKCNLILFQLFFSHLLWFFEIFSISFSSLFLSIWSVLLRNTGQRHVCFLLTFIALWESFLLKQFRELQLFSRVQKQISLLYLIRILV